MSIHFRFTTAWLSGFFIRTVFLFFLFGFVRAGAQLPPGLDPATSVYLSAATNTPHVLPAPDVKQLRLEDEQSPEQSRFAAPMPASLSPENAGRWYALPDSSWVWQCRIQSADALALVLLFEELRMPEGGRLYAYDPVSGAVKGPVTKAHQTPGGKYTLGPIPGSETVLEYHAPAYTRGSERILIHRVDYAYHPSVLPPGSVPESTGFGASLSCNVNIQCPEAVNWQTEKKGVARILMVFTTGSAWCSGTLIANTSASGVPYFLTAHHCQIILSTPLFEQWSFDFNYEFATCAGSPSEPVFQTVVGCERTAWRAETDFLLLKLNPVPNNYNAYFNGWSRSNTPATSASFIHHPKGDVKKYSRDNSAAVSHPGTINWGGQFGISPANTHWNVVPDIGIYEVGSSGCPMFNQDKRVVGQLHGGISNGCSITAAYFGMFHLSWDQGATANARLKDWLDPANTGATTQNGYVQPPSPVSISGNIKSWWGVNMPNVQVALSGTQTDTVTTDASGNYTFSNLPQGGNYTVTPLTKANPLNGVDAFDLILVSRHILNLEPLSPGWKLIAADVNGNGTVTTFDNVDCRKVILGSLANFPIQKSWRYFPANATFADPANPFADLPSEFISLTNLGQNATGVNFFGVKTGDVNSGANPAE